MLSAVRGHCKSGSSLTLCPLSPRIRALIFVEVVPESVSLPVLQHKICNFQIKYGMSHIKTTHVPSLHLTMTGLDIKVLKFPGDPQILPAQIQNLPAQYKEKTCQGPHI